MRTFLAGAVKITADVTDSAPAAAGLRAVFMSDTIDIIAPPSSVVDVTTPPTIVIEIAMAASQGRPALLVRRWGGAVPRGA